MSRTVYDYPQSSCDCNCVGACQPLPHLNKDGPTSSLGVRGCDLTPFQHTDRQSFGTNVQPQFDKSGYTYLNPKIEDSSATSDYFPVSCPFNGPACGKVVYGSTDPRLVDVVRSMAITIDRPPTNDAVPLSEVYTRENLRHYGSGYDNYSDINAGQIMYYVDKSIEDPFHDPVFGTQANVSAYIYKDPMGGIKPHYDRKSFTQRDVWNTKNAQYTGGLSWIDDSNSHREDLLSKQLWQQNQQKWSSRWAAYK